MAKKYDYKRLNCAHQKDLNVYFYRGVAVHINEEVYYLSARDIGNYVAGYVSAIRGLSWETARFGFDMYETKNQIRKGKIGFFKEGRPSQCAQMRGYVDGIIKKKQ